MPGPWLSVITWGSLAAEILFLPSSVWRRTRILSWCTLTAMNVAILFVINFADLTIGMLFIHFFTYDPDWLPTRLPIFAKHMRRSLPRSPVRLLWRPSSAVGKSAKARTFFTK